METCWEGKKTVVLGLPEATPEKLALLQKVVGKRITEAAAKHGLGQTDQKYVAEIVKGDDGESKKFAIINHEEPHSSDELEYKLRSVALDKKHRLHLINLQHACAPLEDRTVDDDFKDLVTANKTFNESLAERYKRTHLWKWFHDPGQREMFVVRAGDATQIFGLDSAVFETELIDDGRAARAEKKVNLDGREPVWTFGHAFWSPAGTYLVTTHTQGIRLWGGDDFQPLGRLAHRNVERALFSRNEEWVLTWDGNTSVILHSVITSSGRRIPCPDRSPHGSNSWPLFTWSHDSKYLAAPLQDGKGIIIYSLPHLTPVKYSPPSKPGTTMLYLPFENALFGWQPSYNVDDPPVLAVWVPAVHEAAPGRLTLLSVPDMKVLASRNLFVNPAVQPRMFWHREGIYCGLLAQVEKRQFGRKKQYVAQFEVFRLHEKSIPVDSITWEDVTILDIIWAPMGNRFTLIRSDRKVMFYALTKKGIEHCATLEVPREMNVFRWNALSTHFVIGSCCSNDSTGLIWFGHCIDQSNNPDLYKIEIVKQDEMNKLVDLAWDPSGRFVTSMVCSPVGSQTGYRVAGAAGYTIWSFQGHSLISVDQELNRFQWRPHPPVHMSRDDLLEVKKRLEEYSQRLETYDVQKRNQRGQEIEEMKKRIQNEFFDAVKTAKKKVESLPGYEDWEKACKQQQAEQAFEEKVVETLTEISVTVKPTNVPTRVAS